MPASTALSQWLLGTLTRALGTNSRDHRDAEGRLQGASQAGAQIINPTTHPQPGPGGGGGREGPQQPLTAVRRCECDGLGSELVVEVPGVDLGCHLRLEGRRELRRGAESGTWAGRPGCQAPGSRWRLTLTFLCTTSCQLMLRKNLCSITSLASLGPPPSLGRDEMAVSTQAQLPAPNLSFSEEGGEKAWGAPPLLGVLLEQPCEQGLGLGAECAWEADLLQEDEFEEALVVLVVEGQAAAHHLVHDHAQPPPVHRPAIVIVFQHLGWGEGQ